MSNLRHAAFLHYGNLKIYFLNSTVFHTVSNISSPYYIKQTLSCAMWSCCLCNKDVFVCLYDKIFSIYLHSDLLNIHLFIAEYCVFPYSALSQSVNKGP